MSDRRPTIWEQAQRKGYSRRDFLRFCSWLAAAAGIPTSAMGQVVRAMDSKPRPPVVWRLASFGDSYRNCRSAPGSLGKEAHNP